MGRVLLLINALWGMTYHGTRLAALTADMWLIVHRVPHQIRHTLLRPAFWIGLTLGFPLEHLLWEKLWPFDMVTKWLGL